ncbi:CLUMA_CG008425, isoform A [Clunio marinus]|uniref:Regulator of microtubule dynamics protein 1 n=1 Tax=Clunio marinus TaxID=568069 RepID=A0A1J1I7K1_9DIPT|nr:CLUMA_CG008425, isoform A [Clunio marinus]
MTDLKVQLEKADQLVEDNKYQDAVDFLKTLDVSNPEVSRRLGRALFKLSGSESNNANKAQMIRDGYKFVSESLEKDDTNFATHKWYAILLDAKSNLDGIKERITQLENVKKHMMRAIELNPEDPTSRYILGEFAFGLADLPWYQRKIVSTIFATPPSGTYEEALESFLKAESLEADFYSMNKLMIGKCYYQLKNMEKAKEYLTKAVNIPVQNEDDRKCKSEAESLLKKVK